MTYCCPSHLAQCYLYSDLCWCHLESGEWCSWNEWSQCTATCTGLNSMQVRQRSCQCPGPQSGGSECDGKYRYIL